MPERAVACPACATLHRFEDVVPRRAGCDRCGAALRCCMACTFHDPSAYNECNEPNAERVVDKHAEKLLRLFPTFGGRSRGSERGPAAVASSDLERLFRKS